MNNDVIDFIEINSYCKNYRVINTFELFKEKKKKEKIGLVQ